MACCMFWADMCVRSHSLRSERWSVAFCGVGLQRKPSEHHGGQRRRSHGSNQHPSSSNLRKSALLWWWVKNIREQLLCLLFLSALLVHKAGLHGITDISIILKLFSLIFIRNCTSLKFWCEYCWQRHFELVKIHTSSAVIIIFCSSVLPLREKWSHKAVYTNLFRILCLKF